MQVCVVLGSCWLPVANKTLVPDPPESFFTGSCGHSPHPTVCVVWESWVSRPAEWASKPAGRPGGLGLEGILLSPSPPKSSWVGETGTGAVACGPLCPLLALSDDVSFVLGVLGLSVPLLKWAPRVGVGQTRAAFLGRRHTCLRKLLLTLLRAEGGLLLAEVTVLSLPPGSR